MLTAASADGTTLASLLEPKRDTLIAYVPILSGIQDSSDECWDCLVSADKCFTEPSPWRTISRANVHRFVGALTYPLMIPMVFLDLGKSLPEGFGDTNLKVAGDAWHCLFEMFHKSLQETILEVGPRNVLHWKLR